MAFTVSNARAESPERSAGIILHPTSLSGPFGIGDLGPSAFDWVDTLARAGQKWWQVLPLGPTAFGDSPYQSPSAFAGNINLLSPELLFQDGLLDQADLASAHFPPARIDYGPVIKSKNRLLHKAWHNFRVGRGTPLREPFDAFRRRHGQPWLDDFALFMAIKESNAFKNWQDWDRDQVQREAAALTASRNKLAEAIERLCFGQFLFFRQWRFLKDYANGKSIRLIGDVPIFVASDSADVWANPDLFFLDAERRPTVVAGVPPDYFSETGQLWGNPLFNWERSRQSGHAWWLARMRWALEQVDLIRIDHFRGFEGYWEIPAGAPTAQNGRWVKGPGLEFFQVLSRALGRLPLIAEDLGVITPEVEALRDQLGLPGMRVLQFAFTDDAKNPFLPHNHIRNTFVYTGTHDNDTAVGWYATRGHEEHERLHRYAPNSRHDVAHELMRLAWSSVADYAIAPLQDLLNLGTEARMNHPGRPANNWSWRLRDDQLTPQLIDWLGELTAVYGR